MKRHVLVVLALIVLTPPVVPAQGHVHGEAALDIGLEGKTGTFELRAPADDIYGFEHEPRDAKEKATRDSAVALFRTHAATLVQFDAALGCKSTPGTVTYSTGKHVEVIVRFEVACLKDPAGHDIRFGVTKTFPAVGVVKVQLVTESGQTALRVVKDVGVVRP